MQMGITNASPTSNTALKNATKLGTQNSLPGTSVDADEDFNS